jgi:hypothetical protein
MRLNGVYRCVQVCWLPVQPLCADWLGAVQVDTLCSCVLLAAAVWCLVLGCCAAAAAAAAAAAVELQLDAEERSGAMQVGGLCNSLC